MISEHALAEAARGTGIRMLALFGSRARGDTHPGSDWDFGYLAADGGADLELLRCRLSQVLDTDAIDLVDLVRAGALLRTRAAAEGTVLFESEPGTFLTFRDEAARFWCDAEPVLTRAYATILAEAAPRWSPQSAILAEKIAAVEQHLGRIAERLPPNPAGLAPMTDASDVVILHLWQAVQVVIDLAVSTCVQMGLGAPTNYGDAFRRLANAQVIEPTLGERLTRAAGFRNVVAHAYETLDMNRVFASAMQGPADLRAFLAVLARLADKG